MLHYWDRNKKEQPINYSGKEHISSRLNPCRKAFYSLHGAGLSQNSLNSLCIYGQVHARLNLCCYMAVNPCMYENKILKN